MEPKKVLELIIKYLKGKMSSSKLAEELNMSYSDLITYKDELIEIHEKQFTLGYHFGWKECKEDMITKR